MQREITDPIEQEKIISEFAAENRQQRADQKARSAWRQHAFWLLGLGTALLIIDQFADFGGLYGGKGSLHTFGLIGALFLVGCLWLLVAKVAAMEEKLDRLIERGRKIP